MYPRFLPLPFRLAKRLPKIIKRVGNGRGRGASRQRPYTPFRNRGQNVPGDVGWPGTKLSMYHTIILRSVLPKKWQVLVCGGRGIDSTVPTNTVPITTGTVTDSCPEYTGFISDIGGYVYRTGELWALDGWPSTWLECWLTDSGPMCGGVRGEV